jgi:hypothetical protein
MTRVIVATKCTTMVDPMADATRCKEGSEEFVLSFSSVFLSRSSSCIAR